MYTLYVIPGSHACRSAMLMLDHKGLPYRPVEFVTMLHPVAARMRGFDTGGETRSAGGKRPFGLRFADRMGTVPGLKAGDRRISTNHGIARFLDEEHPEPPLFPADPDERAAVEEAERWANEHAPDGRPPDPGRGDPPRPREVRPVGRRRAGSATCSTGTSARAG